MDERKKMHPRNTRLRSRAAAWSCGPVRVAIGALAAAVVGAAPAGASAQVRARPEPARLEYDASAAGESCPEESLLRNVVASHLGGRDPFTSDARQRIVITVRRKGDAFVAVGSMYDAAGKSLGEREVSEGSCTGLVETMGTIVGNWLVNSTRPPAPRPAPPAPAMPDPPDPQPPAPQPTPPRRPRFVAELGPVVSFATLPATAAFGIAGGVGVRWPLVSVVVGAQGEPPASMTSSATTPPTEVRGSRVVGTLAPCVHLRWFRGCGVLIGGVVIIEGHMDGLLKHYTYAYGAGGGRVGADVPLVEDRLSLSLTLDALAPFAPPTTTVFAGKRSIWTAPPISVGLGARLVALF